MSYDQLVSAVRDHAGLSSHPEAIVAVNAVFAALARRILVADRRAVVTLLPEELHAAFEDQPHDDDERLDTIVHEVAQTEGIADGFGREHLAVVGAAAAQSLHPDAVAALRTHLPEAVGGLFEAQRVVRAPRPTPLEVPRAHERRLAQARPGSRHPLSEASADRAHTESVARSDDPHGDTKLSGAAGMTQEREHETLAEGEE